MRGGQTAPPPDRTRQPFGQTGQHRPLRGESAGVSAGLGDFRHLFGCDAEAIEQWQQVIRVRTDEPNGWLSLSRAQVLAGEKTAAIKTLQQVIATQWDSRFGDVKRKALQILAPLSKPPR